MQGLKDKVILVATAVRAYGGLDAAHVNAGAIDMVPRDTDVVDIDLEVWDRTIAVNLRGHRLVTRPAYAVTKAGINALARHGTSPAAGAGKASAPTPSRRA